jgi:antitoxin component YwqK of YwqJK toxin-antitoxin module
MYSAMFILSNLFLVVKFLWQLFNFDNVKSLIYILIFLNASCFYAQNKRDANGKRVGKWVFTSEQGSNVKVEEGYYVKGRKEGQWVAYYKDGKKVRLRGNYTNNRPEGDYKRFYENNLLKEVGSFGHSKYKGELLRYHENGNLAYKGNYNNEGQESGLIQYFHENGNLALEYTVKNGKISGELKRYHLDGSMKEKIDFDANGKPSKAQKFAPSNNAITTPVVVDKKDNLPPYVANPKTKGVRFSPNGYNKIYNDNEEIWMDGEFKNGRLWDGKVFDYDNDGILLKVRIFKNGKYHSDGQL